MLAIIYLDDVHHPKFRPERAAMKIEGSVALVTGANRGIGRAIADELLARGAATVYAGVRDVASVTDERLLPVELDVTDPAQVAAAAQRLGDVQIVVNNAGIGGGSTPLSSDLDHARAELEVNYLGLVSMTQAFAPVLAANGGGAFVNVLSVVSWVAIPSLTTYSASKAAAWSYTNSARVELARSDTQVVGVHVGFVDTDLTAGLPVDKIAPQAVASSALDALEEGRPEAVVDEFSAGIKAALHDDQSLIYPAIADQFNAARISAV
jgi:NAD(P)-dependent dehydrogenase (short-subunit alcohol dehydrogenase family)